MRTYLPIPALMINTHSSEVGSGRSLPLGEGVLVAEAQESYPGVVFLFPNRALWFGSATLPLYRQGKARHWPFGLPFQSGLESGSLGRFLGFASGCPTTSKDDHLCPPMSRCKIALDLMPWEVFRSRAEVPLVPPFFLSRRRSSHFSGPAAYAWSSSKSRDSFDL